MVRCLERSQKVKGKPPFIARRYGRPSRGRVEAEARPSKLATATRVRASKGPKPSEAEAGPSEAELGRARPSQAEPGRAGPSWAGGKEW